MLENNEYQDKDLAPQPGDGSAARQADDGTTVIPVIEEFVTVDKEVVETKVYISKRSDEKEVEVNIPLVKEGYTIERKAVKSKLYEKAPEMRYEGENMVIPVVQEVLVIEKKYEVIEEVHVIKTRTETPHVQQIPLMKEQVIVERVPSDRSGNRE